MTEQAVHVVDLVNVRNVPALSAAEHRRPTFAAWGLAHTIILAIGASLEGDASFVVLGVWREADRAVSFVQRHQ